MDGFLTTKDMMELLGCKKSTLDRWEVQGLIPPRIALRRNRHGRATIIRWCKKEVMTKLSGLPAQSPTWPLFNIPIEDEDDDQ